MPTSEFGPTDTLMPETPDGYGEPERFQYSLVTLLAIAVLVVPPALVLFGTLLYIAQGPEGLRVLFLVEETETSISFTIASGSVAVAFLGAVVCVTVLHELVHGLVYRLRGYRVSYGVAPQLGAFYAAAFHQFQSRDDNVLVGIAPLVLLDLLLIPVLFVPVPVVAFAAFIGLVFNTAGAAGDLYLVTRLLRMPEGTVMYDSDPRSCFVFYPESA